MQQASSSFVATVSHSQIQTFRSSFQDTLTLPVSTLLRLVNLLTFVGTRNPLTHILLSATANSTYFQVLLSVYYRSRSTSCLFQLES